MNEAVKILMFEDNSEHQEMFLTYLGMTAFANADVITTPSMQAGLALLESADFDIIFLDLSLTDSTTGQSLQSIEQLVPYCPVVVLTSLDDRETIMSIINKGAQDCLPKSELSDLILERTIRFNLDRWRLGRELFQSEQKVRRFSQALEQSSEAVIITDVDGKIEHINPAFTALTGHSFDEVRGNKPSWLENKSDQACSDVWETINSGEVWKGRIVDRKEDGASYPSMLTVSPIKNGSSEVINFVGIQHDLTEYERLEERLHQSRKMEAVGTLIAGVAHEINNPLAGIMQTTQNIKRRFSQDLVKNVEVAKSLGIELEKVRAYLDERGISGFMDGVSDSGKRIADVVSRLEKLREQKGTRLPVDLNTLIQGAAAQAEQENAQGFENIDVEYDLDEALPKVTCIAEEIGRALLNIINNAATSIRVTDPTGKIVVRSNLRGEMVLIEVEDNGCGMEQSELEKIFEPFYTTASPEREGLGLSTAYVIICINHGGHMNVESETNRGTKIIIELPIGESR